MKYPEQAGLLMQWRVQRTLVALLQRKQKVLGKGKGISGPPSRDGLNVESWENGIRLEWIPP